MVTIEVEPLKVAKWLQVTSNQRKRFLTKVISEYGSDSATTLEVRAEIAELDATINKCVKDAAAAPKRK